MSLVNEALRKAAQQAAANRAHQAGESLDKDLASATYEPSASGSGRTTTWVVGGSTVVIAVLLIGVIVAIKSAGGPASAAAAPDPIAPTPAPAPEPVTPKAPLIDVRPHPVTDLEPVVEVGPQTPELPGTATPQAAEPEPVVPVTPPADPVVAPTPVTPPTPAEPVAPEPTKLRLVPEGEYFKTLDVADAPPMELGAIIFSERLQAALLNGRMVEAGSNVDGVKVEAVQPKRVTLRSPLGVRFYMTLP